jgi:hypothetical protein
MARLGGRVQGEVDCRGRWRNTQRISDRHTSISLPFIDASVAPTLAVGGPAKYEPKLDSNISDHWLASEFVPHIDSRMGNHVALLLGKALLWAVMEPTMMAAIPPNLRVRLRTRYLLIQVLEEEVNPIRRITLSVYSVGGQAHIDPTVVDEQTREVGRAPGQQQEGSRTTPNSRFASGTIITTTCNA